MLMTLLAVLSLLGGPAGPGPMPAAPPNFVVIFADDLGYGDLGCYGHPTIETPRIDRMATEGLRFTQFYSASAVCSPSRAALLTGRLPIRSGLCGHRRRDVMRQGNVRGLDEEELTIAEALRARGYATAAIGKWHLGHLPAALPTRHGFDRSFCTPWSNDMQPYYFLDHDERVPGQVAQRTLTRRLTDEALDFIREAREQPFFLYLAHPFPHTPLFVSDEHAGRSARGLYGDVVAELDWSTGRILDELDSLGLADNTLVVFTSDNGPWLTQGANGGSAGLLRDGKGSTFEGGMRVPAIAWWPGHVGAGGVALELASTMDLFATFVGLAGGALPEDRALDSHDLAPVLLGTGGTTREQVLFYRGKELYAARLGAWKAHFVTQPAYGPGERVEHEPPLLYQLAHDPSERFDRAAEEPERLARLVSLADEHRRSFDPPPSIVDDRAPRTTLALASGEDRAAAAGWGTGTWYDQHEAICRIGLEHPVELVFLGDSITQSFGGPGRSVSGAGAATWNERFAPRAAANFGISGDRTEHLLWRIEHGAFEHTSPELVVLMIGTNNLPHDSAEATAAGVEAVVERLLVTLPESKLLLLGVFPRGEDPTHAMRAKVRAVNARLSALDARERVTFRDLNDAFLLDDGRANPALLADDFLHLRPAGYNAWADAIESDIERLTSGD